MQDKILSIFFSLGQNKYPSKYPVSGKSGKEICQTIWKNDQVHKSKTFYWFVPVKSTDFLSFLCNTLRLMLWPETLFICSYSAFLHQFNQIPNCPFLLVPDVIVLAEDHSSFAEAGAADLSQLSLAAWALEAARVPVPIHGEEQEAIRDPTSAACTGAHCPAAASCYRNGGFHAAVHHRLPAG